LAWGEIDEGFEEEEFHTPLRSLMKEFSTILTPQPTPKTYFEIESHVHSTIVEHLISLNIAQLSFHKPSVASHKFAVASNKSEAAKATTKQKVRGSKKSTLP
jgi:hypothetical protein